MGSSAENRRHNAEAIKRLFGRGTRPPDVPKLQRRGDVGGLVQLLGYSGADSIVDNWAVQRDATAALVDIGDPAVPALASVIDKVVAGEPGRGVDDPAAEHAASALADMGPHGLSALVGALRRHGRTDRRTPNWAVEAVNGVKYGEPALAELLTAMSDPEPVQGWAQDVLGEDPGAVDALEQLAAGLDDERAAVRTYAAYALARLGDQRALEPLLRLAEDPAEQRRATQAVIDLVEPVVLIEAVRRRDTAGPMLCAILKWVRGSDRARGVTELHLPGDPLLASLDEQIAAEHAKSEEAKQVRCDTLGELAVRALLDLGGPGLMDGLVNALDAQFGGPTTDLAVQALAELGDRSAVEPLGAYALRVHGHRAVGHVLRALGKLGGSEAALTLSEWLARWDPGARQVALLALRAIADRDGVDCVAQTLPALLAVLGSENELILDTASDALDWQKEMEHESEREAWQALSELLVAIGEPAVPALAQIRDQHPSPYRREEARRLLDRVAGAHDNRQP
jgi:HEAT repeat protein